MEVLNPRAALLSNYEVWALLQELESDHLSRAKTAVRIKKEEEASGHTPGQTGQNLLEASENLRTIEIEAIQYLSADYLRTQRQTSEGIVNLTKALSPFELTKAEKLQVVNLCPVLPVELYVIVEELEDRLGDRMGEILTLVTSSLSTAPLAPAKHLETGGDMGDDADGTFVVDEEYTEENVFQEDVVFDDTGEGKGIEGDLDVEED